MPRDPQAFTVGVEAIERPYTHCPYFRPTHTGGTVGCSNIPPKVQNFVATAPPHSDLVTAPQMPNRRRAAKKQHTRPFSPLPQARPERLSRIL